MHVISTCYYRKLTVIVVHKINNFQTVSRIIFYKDNLIKIESCGYFVTIKLIIVIYIFPITKQDTTASDRGGVYYCQLIYCR